MKVNELIKLKDFELLTNEETKNNDFCDLFACDLLSHVMGNAEPGVALVTVISNINVVAVASLLELPVIILSNGTKMSESVIFKANENGIAVLTSKLSTVDVIRKILC